MRETINELELEKLCKEIAETHQKEFEEIIKGEHSEYDAIMKYNDVCSSLHISLEHAVQNFNPKISNLLQLQYARLKQYSVGIGHYLDFTKSNNKRIEEKYFNSDE